VAVGAKEVAATRFFNYGLPFKQPQIRPVKSFFERIAMMQFKYRLMPIGESYSAIQALTAKQVNYFDFSSYPAILNLSIKAPLAVNHYPITVAFLFVKFRNITGYVATAELF
jgi:hypothetical protein